MSNVLTIHNPGAQQSTREQRIQRLSRVLSWIFTALLALAIASALAGTIVSLFLPQYIQIGASGAELTLDRNFNPGDLMPGMVWLSSQSLPTRIAGIADIAIATVPVAFIALHLRVLFRLYASGVVFAYANSLQLKRIGLWLLAYPFAKFGANLVYQLSGGPDKAWFSSLLFYSLLLGVVVFVIAQVMEMGIEIERERAEFV